MSRSIGITDFLSRTFVTYPFDGARSALPF